VGKLPRMGKPPFLKPHHVQQDDLVEIVEEPYVRSAEESKFGRMRGYAIVRLVRTGDLYTWGMNTTTWDRCVDSFGEDSALWKGKKVKIKKMPQVVRGENREVLLGVPYIEPQRKLELTGPTQPRSLEGEILEKIKGLPAEQKKALLEALKE
jgi:hypothetical protein